MTDDTSAAVERLRLYIEYDGGALPTADARAILAHIAALEARAKEAEAEVRDMRQSGEWMKSEDVDRLQDAEARLKAAEAADKQAVDAFEKAYARAEQAEAREAALREAAEPFARHAKFYAYDPEEEIFCATVLVGSTGEKHRLTVGDLRRLAQALAAAPTAPESRESRVAKLERLLREARADVEYIADAESGSAEGAASRDLLADIDAALAEAEGRDD